MKYVIFIFCIIPTLFADYKTGIDITFSGVQGTDWQEEVFWYSAIEDPTRAVYLKSSVTITMAHNARNVRTPGVVIGASGGGVIRYCIDRDWQLKYHWSKKTADSTKLHPQYSTPFSLAGISYGDWDDDDSTVMIVGSSGEYRVTPGTWDRTTDYQYGQEDAFGDEWHQLCYADDDCTIQEALGESYTENYASDGFMMMLVVDPNCPCLSFTATSTGQFYTTPPKVYYIPKIHTQTTYLTNNVTFTLSNVMTAATCYYKWDEAESYTAYSTPVSCDSLENGSHTLYYYYDAAHVKTRTCVKNPAFPSATETHGTLFWKNDTEWETIKSFIQTSGTAHQYRYDSNRYNVIYPTNWDTASYHQGIRDSSSGAGMNALIGKVQGYGDTTESKSTRDDSGAQCAQRAKRMLLDNYRCVPDLGRISGGTYANPCREIRYRGYVDSEPIWSYLLAYEILIDEYKNTDSGYESVGITPIEDYKIRDMLARWVLEAIEESGEYNLTSQDFVGMWGACRQLSALAIAIAIPTYSTSYYGSSEFDGVGAAKTYTPFPDNSVTWKDILYDAEYPVVSAFPNYCDPPHVHSSRFLITNPTTRTGDSMPLPQGSWGDRVGYAELCGDHIRNLYNILKISTLTTGKTYATVEAYFSLANSGTLYASVLSGDSPNPFHIKQLTLINHRFYSTFAVGAESYLGSYTGPSSLIGQTLYSTEMLNGAIAILFYNPNYLPPDPDPEDPDPDEPWYTGSTEEACTISTAGNFTVTALHPDMGETVTITAARLPSWCVLNKSTGEVTFTAPTLPGSYDILFTITDGTHVEYQSKRISIYTGGAIYGIF